MLLTPSNTMEALKWKAMPSVSPNADDKHRVTESLEPLPQTSAACLRELWVISAQSCPLESPHSEHHRHNCSPY